MPLQSNPFPASKTVVTDVPSAPAPAPVVTQPQVQTQPSQVQTQQPAPQPAQQPTVIVAPAPPPKQETVFVSTPIEDPSLIALEKAVQKFGSLGGQEAGLAQKIYSFRDQLLKQAQ